MPSHPPIPHCLRLLAIALAAGPVAAQRVWVQRSPAASPSPRYSHAMAYDPARGRVVLFGSVGANGIAKGDTWEWDGTTWTQRTPSTPTARFGAGMAWDAARQKILLAAGRGNVSGFFIRDSWTWSGTAWTNTNAFTTPQASWARVACDDARGRCMLFGGFSGGVTFSPNTYEWDGTQWSLISVVTSPFGRQDYGLAYWPSAGRMVMFGGYGQTATGGFPPPVGRLGDTWEWNGTVWTQRFPATSPSARMGHDLVADTGRDRLVLFGGIAGAYVNDTWEWNGTTWQQQAPAQSPSARAYFSMAYDAARGRVVLFGGNSSTGADLGDTWEYFDATAPAPREVALADLDSDGDLDVLTANEGSHDLGLRANDGSGALAAAVGIALAAADRSPVALAPADLDDDGSRDDLAVACQGSHTVVAILDPADPSPAVTSLAVAGLRPADVAAGDLDSNGVDDLVVACEGEPLAGGAGLSLTRNLGPAVPLTLPPGTPTECVKVALGDLDADGDQDLAAVAQGPQDQVLLLAGDGAGALTFAGTLALPTAGLANGLCCADLDRDGDLDLAVALPVLFPTASQSLRVYRYTGSGALDAGDFTAGSDVALTGTLALDLACGDLEDDSVDGFFARTEIAVASAGSGTASVQHGFDGTGFTGSSSLAVGANPVAVALGDLDGDGCDDAVVANQGSNDVTVTLTAPPALAQVYGTGCGGPTIAAVGLPTSGAAAFGVRVSNAVTGRPVLFLFSAGLADVALPPSPCRLLLANPLSHVLLFTDGTGRATFTFGIPGSASLLGGDAYFQCAVFHSPGGAFENLLDFSEGLRIQVGS